MNGFIEDGEQSYNLVLQPEEITPYKSFSDLILQPDVHEVTIYKSYLPPVGTVVEHASGHYRVTEHRLVVGTEGLDWIVYATKRKNLFAETAT